jgi:hypothetical protein
VPETAIRRDRKIKLLLTVKGQLPIKFARMPEVIAVVEGHKRPGGLRKGMVSGACRQRLFIRMYGTGGQSKEAKTSVPSNTTLEEFRSTIDGSIVDQQTLPVAECLSAHASHEVRQKALAVAIWGDDGDLRH